jgi:hypothetical protein
MGQVLIGRAWSTHAAVRDSNRFDGFLLGFGFFSGVKKGLALGYTIIQVETTPNPLARKLVVEPMPGRIVSVFDVTKGSDDPLAAAILGCQGVTNVLIHSEFVSVCFSENTRWATLKGEIGRVIGVVDG